MPRSTWATQVDRLLNIRGELIGINTVMNQSAENIGFAIPVDRVSRSPDRGTVPGRQPRLAGLRSARGRLDRRGTASWVEGPASDQAGICEGDRILSLAWARRSRLRKSIVHASLELLPLREVDITLSRGGERTSLKRASSGLGQAGRPAVRTRRNHGARHVGELNSSAVVVDRLRPGGPAETLGLKVGDLLPAHATSHPARPHRNLSNPR